MRIGGHARVYQDLHALATDRAGGGTVIAHACTEAERIVVNVTIHLNPRFFDVRGVGGRGDLANGRHRLAGGVPQSPYRAVPPDTRRADRCNH